MKAARLRTPVRARMTAGARARSYAGAAALGLALLSACASGPAASSGEPQRKAVAATRPGPEPSGGAAVAAALPARPRPSPVVEMDGYYKAAFAEYRRETLANGSSVAVKRQAGRPGAAATVILARDGAEEPSRAGYDGLALAAAARSVQVKGLSFRLGSEGWDEVSLELSCPPARMAEALALLAKALASPAFSDRDFEASVREARIAERRSSGDPFALARAELASASRRGSALALPPFGTAASLAAATREGVMRHWSERFAARRLSVAIVGDFEPAAFLGSVTPAFGALPRGVAAVAAPPPPATAAAAATTAGALPAAPATAAAASIKAIAIPSMQGRALLRAEFPCPEPASPDYPAILVALAALDELVAESLGGTKIKVSSAPLPSASAAASRAVAVTMHWTQDPAAAMAAVGAAAAELAAGRCADPGTSSRDPIALANCLETYRSRALASYYAGAASSEAMASRIALDLASGGDGAAIFRMSARLRAVGAEEVSRAAATYLAAGAGAWVALGDPSLCRAALQPASRPLPAK